MKLYATVTSERASKGQGGNEFIDCIVTIDKIPVARIEVKQLNEKQYAVDYYTDMRDDADFAHGLVVTAIESEKIGGFMTQPKGKKQ